MAQRRKMGKGSDTLCVRALTNVFNKNRINLDEVATERNNLKSAEHRKTLQSS